MAIVLRECPPVIAHWVCAYKAFLTWSRRSTIHAWGWCAARSAMPSCSDVAQASAAASTLVSTACRRTTAVGRQVELRRARGQRASRGRLLAGPADDAEIGARSSGSASPRRRRSRPALRSPARAPSQSAWCGFGIGSARPAESDLQRLVEQRAAAGRVISPDPKRRSEHSTASVAAIVAPGETACSCTATRLGIVGHVQREALRRGPHAPRCCAAGAARPVVRAPSGCRSVSELGPGWWPARRRAFVARERRSTGAGAGASAPTQFASACGQGASSTERAAVGGVRDQLVARQA